MNERLQIIRKNAKMTQESFSSSIGVTRTMLAKYETGRVPLPTATQMLICEKFNVNPAWLETGEGKPYKEGIMPELIHVLRQMPGIYAALERVLPIMTDADWRALDSFVSRLMGEKPVE